MSGRVSFSDNCGTNPFWSYFSWSTGTPDPGLLSVSFLMDPYLSPFVIHFLILSFPNIQDAKICTSLFKYRNIDGSNPSFASLNMYLVWRWDNLLCPYSDSCCKGDSTSINMMFSICSCVILFDSFNSPLRRLELIQYLAYSLTWRTTY